VKIIISDNLLDSLTWYENKPKFKWDFMSFYVTFMLNLSIFIVLLGILYTIFVPWFYVLLASALTLIFIEIFIPFYFYTLNKLKFKFAFNGTELFIKNHSGTIEKIQWEEIYKLDEYGTSGIALWKAHPGMKTFVIRGDETVISQIKDNYNKKMKAQLDKRIAKLRAK